MQKRYLLNNIKNIFLSLKRENPDLKCSYSTFTQYRPFYAILPTVTAREKCLCRIHINIQYAFALCKNKVIPPSDLNKIIIDQVYDANSSACMIGICFACQLRKIKYDTTKDEIIVKYLNGKGKLKLQISSKRKSKL